MLLHVQNLFTTFMFNNRYKYVRTPFYTSATIITTLSLHIVSQPVGISEENRGSLERNEQVRWQIDIPVSGRQVVITVDQGEIVFYASTETTAPNEAFHQWTIRTSSSAIVFIQPSVLTGNVTDNLIPVYTALVGLGSSNTFTLTGGAFVPPSTNAGGKY